jgi:hypothetical protein
MNHFSFEVMGKEKIDNLIEEGMRSQAVSRAGLSRRIERRLPRLMLVILGILAIAELIVR